MGLVAIRRLLFAWEAELLGARLRAAGIPCEVIESHVRANWSHAFALGGAAVWVDELDLPRALEVLREPDPAPLEPEACARCGSEAVGPVRPGPFWLVGSMLLSLPLPFARRGSQCASCGHRWRAAREARGDPLPAELLAAEREIGVGIEGRGGMRKAAFWIGYALLATAVFWWIHRISNPAPES